MKLRAIEGISGLYEIIDSNGHSAFDQDAAKFGMSREIKRELKNILVQVCLALHFKNLVAFDEFITHDLLKKIERNPKAIKHNLWEVRSSAHGGRLFFVMDKSGNIIVSAADKRSKDRAAQEKAINRGINRWQKILKN